MYELINDVQIKVKEYNGQRVVTFKDIDTVHNRPAGTAHRNFKANRKRFIEGEDFFLVKATDGQKDEFRPFGFEIPNRGIILLTESGYLMLVKSFTDDLSWSVQRQLVKTYFRARQTETLYNETILKILENQEEIRKELKTSVDRLEKRQSNLRQYVKKEFVHIRKDIKEIFDDSLGKNNQTMIPALISINDNISKIYNNVSDTVKKFILQCLYK